MIGFDVSINGEKISAAIDKGGLTLLITKLNTETHQYISLDMTGLDKEAQKQLKWANREDLKAGDEIIITIKNIQEISAPISVNDIDGNLDKETRLKRFYEWKEKLEKEGLL